MSSPAERHPVRRVGSATRHTFRSLRVRNYRLWFTGQTISLSGTWMQAVGQGWLVYTMTHNAFYLGLTAAFQFLPVLLLGAYGGVIADRFDKRSVLIATQTFFMAQAAGDVARGGDRCRPAVDGLVARLGLWASSTCSTTRRGRASPSRW